MLQRTLAMASVLAYSLLACGCSNQSSASTATATDAPAQVAQVAPAIGETVRGKIDLPVYPGAVVVGKPERAIAGGLAYHYQTGDPVETVYAWYQGKVPGEERAHVDGKMVTYASAGSEPVDIMIVLAHNGRTDVVLSPQ